MNAALERWMASTVGAVHKGLAKGEALLALAERIAKEADKVPNLNVRERAFLKKSGYVYAKNAKKAAVLNQQKQKNNQPSLAMAMTSPRMMKTLEHAANQVTIHSESREKTDRLADTVAEARARGEIFFLVSSHQRPACGHEPLQGKLLVDRFWRETLRNAGLAHYIPTIAKFIESRRMRRVQEAIGAPTYLITRPNCKHFLTPIPTVEALGMSEHELSHEHREARVGTKRSMTPNERYAAYVARRLRIRSSLASKAREAI